MRDENRVEKPYYNQAIEADIDQIIPRDKYKDFTTLLRDMFHRRAYEYDFSEQEILAEARNFAKNVSTIEFVSKDEMYGDNNMGVYSPSNHTIRINQDYYMARENNKDFSLAMYSTLVHEVYHAINDHSDDLNFLGLSYFDSSKGQWVGNALNEVFTETAANRASYGKRIEDADRFRSETDGYGSITFSTNLLAAALGVTEKEVLKAGVQHRGKLEALVKDQFPMSRDFGTRAMNYYVGNFEQALDAIYNVEYSRDQATPKERDMQKSLVIGGLATLFDTTYRLANFQIATDTKDISYELAGSVDHRFRKIEKIMSDTLDEFSRRYGFSQEEVQAIYTGINESRMGLGNRVVGLNMITRQAGKIADPNELLNQVSLAKRGLTFTRDNLDIISGVYGLEMPNVVGYRGAADVTADMGYENVILKEDYDQGMVWDNESAAIVMRNIYREDMIRKGFRTRESYIIQEMPTEELPVVNPELENGKEFDPDKTEQLEVVEDPDKTEPLEVVEDPDKTEPLPPVKLGFFQTIINTIKDRITAFKNRNMPQLPDAAPRTDKSEYYAAMAAKTVEPTFNDRYVLKDFKHIDLNEIQNQRDPEPDKEQGIDRGE